jgi:DNA-binding NtrC family response regulator
MSAAKERAIVEFERTYLAEVLRRCGGNVSQAARVAGKERRAFQRLLRKHNLSSTSFRATTP